MPVGRSEDRDIPVLEGESELGAAVASAKSKGLDETCQQSIEADRFELNAYRQRAAEIADDNDITIHTVAMGDPSAAGEQALDEKTMVVIPACCWGVIAGPYPQSALKVNVRPK